MYRKSFRSILQISIVVLAMVAFLASQRTYLRARFARNLAWIHLARTVNVVSNSQRDLALPLEHLEFALSIDDKQSRLKTVREWFERYHAQAEAVRTNQLISSRIQAALRCFNLGIQDCKEEEKAFLLLAKQTDDMAAWLILASIYDLGSEQLLRNQLLDKLSERSPAVSLANEYGLGELRLEGYDWSPLSQDRSTRHRIVLYWRSFSELPTNLDPVRGIYQWNGRIVQIIETGNYVDNGDFEWTLLEGRLSLPSSWLLASFDPKRTPSVRVISEQTLVEKAVALDMDDTSNSSLHLRLRNAWDSTFLSSIVRGLQGGKTYLFLGQVGATDATTIQIMQNVNGANQFPMRIYCKSAGMSYACAGTFTVQEHGTTYLHLFLNGSSTNSAEYDNLGIFEFEPPEIRQSLR